VVRLQFVERIRGQMKFDSPAALVEQVGRDCRTVKDLLGRRR